MITPDSPVEVVLGDAKPKKVKAVGEGLGLVLGAATSEAVHLDASGKSNSEHTHTHTHTHIQGFSSYRLLDGLLLTTRGFLRQ